MVVLTDLEVKKIYRLFSCPLLTWSNYYYRKKQNEVAVGRIKHTVNTLIN
jgi:hypothetical protein